jgi:hypothetical protein
VERLLGLLDAPARERELASLQLFVAGDARAPLRLKIAGRCCASSDPWLALLGRLWIVDAIPRHKTDDCGS